LGFLPPDASEKAELCDGGHFALAQARYCRPVEHNVQEVAMAATKKIGKRLARWFKTFREQNRPPYKYHEHSLYDA
jgi:hypothetical protein